MPKLTMNYIETKIAPPAHGQVIIRDDDVKGFGLRVTRSSMSYICECRVGGKFRRVTIGRHGQPWTPETARKEARVILGKMAAGQDPVKEKSKKQVISLTLRQAFDEYMRVRPNRVVVAEAAARWFDYCTFSAAKSGGSEKPSAAWNQLKVGAVVAL